MDAEEIKLVKEGIDKKSITLFSQIFRILSKDDMAVHLHINRGRFRGLVRNPAPMRISEINKIAKKLNVQGRQISELIHNQLDSALPKPERSKAK